MSQDVPPRLEKETAPYRSALILREPERSVAAWLRVVLAGALALALGLGLLALLQLLARPLGLLFLGLVIATALQPLVNRLNRFLPRPVAVLLPYIVAIGLVGGAVIAAAPSLVAQAQDALNRLPDVLAAAWGWLGSQGAARNQRLVEALLGRIDAAFSAATLLPVIAATTIAEAVTVVFMSIYWLMALPRLGRFVSSFSPDHQREQVSKVLEEMGQTMGGYLRGVLLDSLAIGVSAYVGLLVLGVRFPLVLALQAGLLEAIPYAGPVLSGAIAVTVAVFDSPAKATLTLAFWIVLQQVENNLLVPYVMRSQTDIPALLVIFAIFAGFAVGGILGALIAIPLSGALRVFALRVIAPLLRRWTGAPVVEEVQQRPAA